MEILFAILIGLGAGISAGLFGIGGGIIIVPLCLYLFSMSQQSATATSLIALLLPVGALGVWQYYSKGFISASNVKVGLFIALGLFVGTFFGAKIGSELAAATLTRVFSIFLVVIAVRLWLTA